PSGQAAPRALCPGPARRRRPGAGCLRLVVPRVAPRRDCRTYAPHPARPTPGNRTETRWRLAEPRGGPRTSRTGRVGPRHVRLPAAAAVCDGARSSNDYSSGRRTCARLETAAGFRSPRSTDVTRSAFTRTAPGTTTPTGVTRFPAVCMAHRLRIAKPSRGQKFTSNQATCSPGSVDVIPFTPAPLVVTGSPFYRRDVSSRYISSA